jgi:peptidoglycan hydrolase-like protein with peptidoglycan-binding domain
MNWKDAFTRASQAAPEFGAAGGVLPGAQALVDSQTARAVQARLNALGAQPQLAVDGSWGPKSANGTAAFQASRGLRADGIPRPDTLNALGVPIPKPPNAPNIPGLKKSVALALPLFQGRFEGSGLPYMYTDKKGNVTTGTGILIDPISMALALPWKNPDGSLASAGDVTAAWNVVKAAYPGVQSVHSEPLTTIRLTPDDLNSVLYKKAAAFHAGLSKSYPSYPKAPADAQLAMLGLAWPWGDGFAAVWDRSYPGKLGTAFKAAFESGNFAALPDIITQASQSEESVNAGIIPRNAAVKQLFSSAADAVAKKANYDNLYWPGPIVAGLIAVTSTMTWVLGGMAAVGLVIAAMSGEFKK